MCEYPFKEQESLQISFDRAYPCGEEKKDVLGTTIYSLPKAKLSLSHPADGLRDHDDPLLNAGVALHDALSHLFTLSDYGLRLLEDPGDDAPTTVRFGVKMDVRSPGRNDQGPSVDHRFDGRVKQELACPKSMVDVNEIRLQMGDPLLKR
jgi:hypothetical protein